MTVQDWIRLNWQQHGPEWVKAHKEECDSAVGKEVGWETWSRSIRRVRQEYESDPSLRPYEINTEGKAELYHEVDPVLWQPDSLTVNTWGSPDNANQQVKMRYNRRSTLLPEDFSEAFKNAVESYHPVLPDLDRLPKKTGLIAEPCLFDFHLGRKSWGSVEQASEAYMDALSDLFRGYSSNDFSEILFPVGHDFIDWDNWQRTTTAGTPMDGHEAPSDVIQAGLTLLVRAIDFLSHFAPVDVVVVPGNHDWLVSHMLGLMLSSWYRGSDDVTIDTDLEDWKFRAGGSWLMALTHGKHPDTKRAMKPAELAAALPLKAPGLWRPDQYREVQTGHLHHHQRGFVPVVVDEAGVMIRRVGTMAKQDSYEKVNNYLSNREAQLIVIDDRGPCDYRSHRP